MKTSSPWSCPGLLDSAGCADETDDLRDVAITCQASTVQPWWFRASNTEHA